MKKSGHKLINKHFQYSKTDDDIDFLFLFYAKKLFRKKCQHCESFDVCCVLVSNFMWSPYFIISRQT